MPLDDDLLDDWLAVSSGLLSDERARDLIAECQVFRDEVAREESTLCRLREKAGVLDDVFQEIDDLTSLAALTEALSGEAQWLKGLNVAQVDFAGAVANTDCADGEEAVAVLARTIQALVDGRDGLKIFIELLDGEEKPAR